MLVDPEIQLLTDWTMKILSMLATWFAACGTTAAVVVALWLARRSDKASGLSRLDFRVWALESRGCVMRGELPNAYPSCT